MRKLPKISIVTPSYNSGKYIRETILSVLNQDYENLEYFVIDGGSTDGTIEILKELYSNEEYAGKFSWISGKDNGQTDAVNKGLRLCTGDWFAFLNADDYYEKNIFSKIAPHLEEYKNYGVIYGNCFVLYEELIHKKLYIPPKEIKFKDMKVGNLVFGPASLYNITALKKVGEFDSSLYHWMDYDMYLRIRKVMPFKYIDKNIVTFRICAGQKSPSNLKNKKQYYRFQKEAFSVWQKNTGKFSLKLFLRQFIPTGRLIFFINHFANKHHKLLSKNDKNNC